MTRNKTTTPKPEAAAFESLADALAGRFDASLRDLPGVLRERVERAFPPVNWGMLSADQRRHRAREWDCDHDPALEEERQRGFDSAVREQEIQSELRQIGLMSPPLTAIELDARKRQLVELRRELTELQSAGRPTQEGEGCAVFRAMAPRLTADKVSITFVAGSGGHPLLDITALGQTRRVTLAEFGLMDMRKGSLNASGDALLALASGRKLLHTEAKAQMIARLRKSIKKPLGLVDDPFEHYRKGAGWEARFKIYDKRDAADKRAEREAGRKTVSYDAALEAGRQFEAGEDWLRKHDTDGQG